MAHGCMKRMKKMFSIDEHLEAAARHSVTGDVPEPTGTAPVAAVSGSMTQVLQPAHTRRLRPETSEAADPAVECSLPEPMSFSCHGISNTGMVRPQNEDRFSCTSPGKWSLYVVADGMGGHDAGEVASRIAVESVCREIETYVKQNEDPLRFIEQVVQQANAKVKKEGARRKSNMGTTLSLALVGNNTAYIANVGDSRVYWMENGSISQITKDHSLVAKLVAAGKMTKEEARNHPSSNLLYRTIGTDENITVDTFRVELKRGGYLILCTDGLWGEVSDEDMHHAILSRQDARAASEELVRMANAHGGKDNITAVVVMVT